MYATLKNRKRLRGLSSFFVNKRYCDVTIKAEDKAFQCHKFALALYSDYFEVMFRTDMLEANSEDATITLHEVSADDLGIIVKFIYEGKVDIIPESIPRLFITASYLEISAIKKECLCNMRERSFKMISYNNQILKLRKLALLEEENNLLLTINKCIEDNFEKIVKIPEITEISLSNFTNFILECKTFFRNEEWLLRGAVIWCNQQQREKRPVFLEFVLGLIDFDNVSTVFLKHCLKGEDLLKDSDMFFAVIRERYYDPHRNDIVKQDTSYYSPDDVTAFYCDEDLLDQTGDFKISTNLETATLGYSDSWKCDYKWPDLKRIYLADDIIHLALRRGKLYELAVTTNQKAFERARLNVCCNDEWTNINLPEDVALGYPKMAHSRNIGLIFSAQSGQDSTQFFNYDDVLEEWRLFSNRKIYCDISSIICDSNRVFVFGEERTYDKLALWFFDLRVGLWYRLPSTLGLRNAVAADVRGKELFACNAYGAIRPGACEFELYDMNAGKWRSVPVPDEQQWPAGRNFVSSRRESQFSVFPSAAAGLHATFSTMDDMWHYDRINCIPGYWTNQVICEIDNAHY